MVTMSFCSLVWNIVALRSLIIYVAVNHCLALYVCASRNPFDILATCTVNFRITGKAGLLHYLPTVLDLSVVLTHHFHWTLGHIDHAIHLTSVSLQLV